MLAKRDGNNALIPVGLCLGYVQGVYDAGEGPRRGHRQAARWDGGWAACVPVGVTGGPARGSRDEVAAGASGALALQRLWRGRRSPS